jgi:hypothetical protein
MDLSSAGVQALLFAIFAAATGAIAAIIGPTYDHLLVPELATGALYPTLTASGGGGFLATAAQFSGYVLTGIVDPAIALVAVALGGLYLLRAVAGRLRPALASLLPRLVVAVLLANVTLPIASAILGLAAATYPVVAGFDGGLWQNWQNLGGYGLLSYSWDNGALAFVIAFVLFSLVLLLATAIAVRNALLGVLLVLLPVFTLLWPIPVFAPLARRAWLWFAELAFLPSVMVVPLELAVGSPSVLLTMGYLVVALAAPALLSAAGSPLTSAGVPGANGILAGGIQRGLTAATIAVDGLVRPSGAVLQRARGSAGLAGAVQRSAGRGPLLALPAFTSELLGHGSARLFGHIAERVRGPAGSFGGPGGGGPGRAGSWRAPPIRSARS